MMKLNRLAYEKLVAEDIAWLKAAAPDTFERRHIILILERSADHEYMTSDEKRTRPVERTGD